jgi:hypothetical protein
MTDIKIESMVTITGAEYVRLMDENAKLREALEVIQNTASPDVVWSWYRDVARAALEGQPAAPGGDHEA